MTLPRRPGPLPPRHLVGVWSLVAVVLGAGIVAEQATQGPHDDPQQARQRPGILVPSKDARLAVPVGDDSPTWGFRTVVFFLRDPGYPALTRALRGWSALEPGGTSSPADVVAVLPHAPQGAAAITPVGSDPSGALARAYDMPVPRAGGPPVGYAIVDSRLRVRYVTLDPGVVDHLDEVATMLGAVS